MINGGRLSPIANFPKPRKAGLFFMGEVQHPIFITVDLNRTYPDAECQISY